MSQSPDSEVGSPYGHQAEPCVSAKPDSKDLLPGEPLERMQALEDARVGAKHESVMIN